MEDQETLKTPLSKALAEEATRTTWNGRRGLLLAGALAGLFIFINSFLSKSGEEAAKVAFAKLPSASEDDSRARTTPTSSFSGKEGHATKTARRLVVSFGQLSRGGVGGNCGPFSLDGKFYVEPLVGAFQTPVESDNISTYATPDGMSSHLQPVLTVPYQYSTEARDGLDGLRIGFRGTGKCPGASWAISWSKSILDLHGSVEQDQIDTADGHGTGATLYFSASWRSE